MDTRRLGNTMTAPHKATPEQWANVERWASEMRSTDACLLELRDRIAALEEDATEHSKSAHFCFETIIQRIEALEQRPIPGSVELAADHFRDAPEMVATDEVLRVEFYSEQREDDARRAIYDLGRQHGANSSVGLTGSNHPAKPDSSPAPAGGLMQSVGAAICTIADCGDTPLNWAPEARAAVLAVAGWLEHRNPGALQWAALLRQEVERHG